MASKETYLEQIKESSAVARQIVDKDPSLDFMDVFHSLMNLYLTPEERLYNGIIRHTYFTYFQTSSSNIPAATG